MPDHFEVWVSDPVAHVRARAGEEVVEDGNFVTEEHKSVNEVRTDEASATGYEYALPL